MEALREFIRESDPVLIGVDAGADALLECGCTPHLIVGEMQLVSNAALQCGAELVMQAKADGAAPEPPKLRLLRGKVHAWPHVGTSEDMALLLANEKQGECLITVGSAADMHDCLQQGRTDMGSRLLIAMKLGSRLADSRTFRLRLERPAPQSREAASTIMLSLVFIALSFVQMHWIGKRLAHYVWELTGMG